MNKILQKELKNIIDFLIEATPDKKIPIADAIFIFGHIDSRVAEKAADVYFLGKASKIIITGKGRKEIPFNFKTEAAYFASILLSKKIPKSALIIEENSTNSLENVIFGMRQTLRNDFTPKNLILCALPPLLRRAHAVFKKHFPDIKTYGCAFQLIDNEYNTPQKTKRILAEIDRLHFYAIKGDISFVKIPKQILKSYEIVSSYINYRTEIQQLTFQRDKLLARPDSDAQAII